jgi:hypothetical protein
VGKGVLYIYTRVSDPKKLVTATKLKRSADARAGEIVTSHKLQILCENEPRGVLEGHSVTYGFLNKGRPDIPPSSARHTHGGPIGTKWEEIIDHCTGDHDEPSYS